jgi:DNA polymerase-3 subunit epsilon
MPWRSASYAALDFEATGLDFARDRIVSFGVVPVERGRVEVGRAVYDLVDPGDVEVSPASVTIHGLRPVDLRGAEPLAAARDSLERALAGRFILAWHASVEASFLAGLFGTRSRRWLRRCVDVRPMALALLDEDAGRLTLTDAAGRFGVPVADPHHALDDALVTAQLFLVAATKCEARGARSVHDLMRVRPAR